jgi:hypothetical protein
MSSKRWQELKYWATARLSDEDLHHLRNCVNILDICREEYKNDKWLVHFKAADLQPPLWGQLVSVTFNNFRAKFA